MALAVAVSIGLLLFATRAAVISAAPTPALTASRHCQYRIAWNGIPAASATVDIATSNVGHTAGYTVETRAATNAFVDLFWRFRGDASATVLAEGLTPLRFNFERQANSTRELTHIEFDQHAALARSIYIKRERRKELEADARLVIDPITAAVRALLSDTRVGDALRYRIFTGESHYETVLHILGEDRINVPAGQFDAWRVEPEVFELGDVRQPDRRLHKAAIWVTREPPRTILRVRSQVFIGVVSLDLIRAEPALVVAAATT